ncbi:MAG: MATE family efflux transporter [Bacteroidales bacterium]|nr:MATE family efflux transporter [Bacteroidales bacterium]
MNSHNQALENLPIKQLFWQYALPAIAAATATPIYNIIDRIFIGQGVGPLAISGLALCFPIMNLGTALGTLVGAGSAAIISIRMGEKKQQEAIQTLGNALILNLLIGLTFSILSLIFLNPILRLFGASDATLPFAHDFMSILLIGNVVTHLFFGLNSIIRASGYPTKAMLSLFITIGVNLMLAPLFIFGFHWGIKGAATATVIAQCAGLVWVVLHFCSHKPYVHFCKSGFRLSGRIIKNIFSIGIAPFIIHCCACIVAIIMNWQLGKYGGDLVIGSFGIINAIGSVLIMFMLGLAQAMQPIVGYNWGAGLHDRVNKTFRLTILCATIVGTVGFLVAELMPNLITRCFTNDAELIKLTTFGLRIYVLCMPLVGFQVVTSNFFQSIGNAKISIILSLSRQVLCLIPFLLTLPLLWKLNGVWISVPAADFASAIFTAIVLVVYKMKNENWAS